MEALRREPPQWSWNNKAHLSPVVGKSKRLFYTIFCQISKNAWENCMESYLQYTRYEILIIFILNLFGEFPQTHPIPFSNPQTNHGISNCAFLGLLDFFCRFQLCLRTTRQQGQGMQICHLRVVSQFLNVGNGTEIVVDIICYIDDIWIILI